MNRNDLYEAMEFIDERIIEKSEGKSTMKVTRKFTKRSIMLVAALCLLTALATTVFAAGLFGLRDVLVDNHTSVSDTDIVSEITLSGFSGSKEYMAAAEWKAFKESYDPDGSILAGIGNGEIPVETKYEQCGAYTQEMADKIDEITEKYGLSLHSGFNTVLSEEWITVVGDFIDSNYAEFSDNAYNTVLSGYIYDDGTFRYDGIFNAPSGRLSVDYQFSRSAKGVFDPMFLNIGDITDYQEQMIVTDSGVEIVAAMSEYKSVLITELDSCFVCINVLGGTGMGITFDDLEALADTFDFSVLEMK